MNTMKIPKEDNVVVDIILTGLCVVMFVVFAILFIRYHTITSLVISLMCTIPIILRIKTWYDKRISKSKK